jgi:hypothetical protein
MLVVTLASGLITTRGNRQDLLSISIKLDLVGFGCPVLRLNVIPEVVDMRRAILSSDVNLIRSHAVIEPIIWSHCLFIDC